MIAHREFRESNVPWIGRVPSHWRTVPTRSALTLIKEEVGPAWSRTPLLSLTKQGVIPRDIDSGEGKFPGSFETYQHLQPDDLVFCLFDIDETPRTIGRANTQGMITGAYTRFVVNQEIASPRYLEWYYIAIDDGKRFRPLYTGLRKVIQKPRFLAAGLVLPPVEEQRAIADYLDRETARVDILIAEQRRFVELSRERRAALITAAVTGKLDDAKGTRSRLPSGEQWLGDVPADWRLVPAKGAFKERRESNLPEDVHLTPSQKHGVLPQSEYMAITGTAVVQNLSGQDNMKHVEPDDFIIHLRSFQGGLERSKYVGKVSAAYTVVTPREGGSAAYFRWLLKCDAYVQELRTTTNQLRDGQSIKFRDFAKIRLPLPPLDEQHAIAQYLDSEVVKIDTLIAESAEVVDLARERRSALITAAVTGQTDIRAAA